MMLDVKIKNLDSQIKEIEANIKNTEEKFNDNDEISDYAQEAVYAMPTRDETALVYRYLREQGRIAVQEEFLFARFCERVGPEKRCNYCKMLVALDALSELNLIRRTEQEITVVPNPGKVDLQSAGILQRLNSMAAVSAQKEGCV